MQWITNSQALVLKQYVAQFLAQHYLSSPIHWVIDEQCKGITLLKDGQQFITFDDDLLIDLDRHWMNPNFVPIPLRNGIAHPNHASIIDDWATIFYLLSQYSECMQEEKDMHQRISAIHSLVVEKRWHERCLVNECAERILTSIQSKIPSFEWHLPQKSFRVSHNVDRPLKYEGEKWKTHVKRALGSYRFGNSFKRVTKELLRLTLLPILKNRVDPFNHFQWMMKENVNFNSKPVFYFSPISQHLEYDPTYHLMDKSVREIGDLILTGDGKIGCLSNYSSSQSMQGITANWKAFEEQGKYWDTPLRMNRQHFQRFHPFNFAEQLSLAGVNEDSSIGYTDRTGWRTSCSLPYYLFDIKNKKISSILEVPFCAMDSAIITPRYMNIASPEKVMAEMERWLKQVERYGGMYCMVWHNATFQYPFYRKTYWQLIKKASQLGECR
jgi:hypothetical protein